MPNPTVRALLGAQNAPTILAIGKPSLFSALIGVAACRVAYGVDALVEGSPTLSTTGGHWFSVVYSIAWLLAALWAFVGTLLTVALGRTRHEFVGLLLTLGGTATLVGALLWNATHGTAHGAVGVWQPVALGWLAAWRMLQIASTARPLPGPQPLRRPKAS